MLQHGRQIARQWGIRVKPPQFSDFSGRAVNIYGRMDEHPALHQMSGLIRGGGHEMAEPAETLDIQNRTHLLPALTDGAGVRRLPHLRFTSRQHKSGRALFADGQHSPCSVGQHHSTDPNRWCHADMVSACGHLPPRVWTTP